MTGHISARKLRLCILTPRHSTAQLGGAEYQIECLLNTLLPTGRYDINYLAAVTNSDSEGHDYPVTRIGSGNRFPRFGFLEHARPLHQALSGIRPDVIYQRVGCGYTGLAAHYARRHGARMIWQVAHDSDVDGGNLDGGRNFVRRTLEKHSLVHGIHHANQIVVQTTQQALLLQRNYGRIPDALIPNFHPEARETLDKNGPLKVVWVANLKKWKQPEAFVRLAARLSNLTDVKFLMVGAPSTGSGDRVWSHALMDGIGRTPNLDYLGERSQNEVNELLAGAHVLVNTSLHEGFPNTFIQAWMREVAVVSLHVNPDHVLDRKRIGLHAGSEELLAAAVRSLLADPAMRVAYARRGRVHAENHHSLRNAGLLAELIDTGKIDSPLPMLTPDRDSH